MTATAAPRRRTKGRDVKRKRPDAAGNAVPKVKYVGFGGRSDLLKDPLDGRSILGKAYAASMAALRQHLGGDTTLPEEELCNQASRLGLLAQISWGDLIENGMLDSTGDTRPAFDAFLKSTRDQRAVLQVLGLKRLEKEVPDLHDYLREQDVKHGPDTSTD